MMLHNRAPASVGRENWDALLKAYNEVIRSHLRAGSTAPTTQEFFSLLGLARIASSDSEVTMVLELIWQGRENVSRYQGERPGNFREMDPMVTTLAAVSRSWRIRLGDVPFEFLADDYWGLDPETRQLIIEGVRAPLDVGRVQLPAVDLRGIRLANSKSDVRIQVADLVAGIGREIARLANQGIFDNPLQIEATDLLDFDVMCAMGSPLDILHSRRPIRYFEEWMANSSPSEG
jgi:hypothetical protein